MNKQTELSIKTIMLAKITNIRPQKVNQLLS